MASCFAFLLHAAHTVPLCLCHAAVLPGHVNGEQLSKTIRTLQTFRNYIQYHMKCAKSYFHSRMRAKCVDLLKVLNRSKMDQGEKKKKTMSGKTFQRN